MRTCLDDHHGHVRVFRGYLAISHLHYFKEQSSMEDQEIEWTHTIDTAHPFTGTACLVVSATVFSRATFSGHHQCCGSIKALPGDKNVIFFGSSVERSVVVKSGSRVVDLNLSAHSLTSIAALHTRCGRILMVFTGDSSSQIALFAPQADGKMILVEKVGTNQRGFQIVNHVHLSICGMENCYMLTEAVNHYEIRQHLIEIEPSLRIRENRFSQTRDFQNSCHIHAESLTLVSVGDGCTGSLFKVDPETHFLISESEEILDSIFEQEDRTNRSRGQPHYAQFSCRGVLAVVRDLRIGAVLIFPNISNLEQCLSLDCLDSSGFQLAFSQCGDLLAVATETSCRVYGVSQINIANYLETGIALPFQIVQNYPFNLITGLTWTREALLIADEYAILELQINRVQSLKSISAKAIRRMDMGLQLTEDLEALVRPSTALYFEGTELAEEENRLKHLLYALDEFGDENEYYAGFDHEGQLNL